jgi:hypothetical protein
MLVSPVQQWLGRAAATRRLPTPRPVGAAKECGQNLAPRASVLRKKDTQTAYSANIQQRKIAPVHA